MKLNLKHVKFYNFLLGEVYFLDLAPSPGVEPMFQPPIKVAVPLTIQPPLFLGCVHNQLLS